MQQTSVASSPSAIRLALLVDRDADTRRMYAQYLTFGAWAVEESGDGREALAKAIARHPHVIVTESRLPGINGFDLCAILKRDSTTRGIPVVMVTADAYASDLQRARTAGADAVLVKPCLPETLVAEIQRLVAQARERHAPAHTARSRTIDPAATSGDPVAPLRHGNRIALSRAHLRHDTTTPPLAPPALVCPSCDQPLAYQRSHVGGVSERHPEQWDYFVCPDGCGTFQYRARTRKLRKVQ